MPVDNSAWRARVGLYNCRLLKLKGLLHKSFSLYDLLTYFKPPPLLICFSNVLLIFGIIMYMFSLIFNAAQHIVFHFFCLSISPSPFSIFRNIVTSNLRLISILMKIHTTRLKPSDAAFLISIDILFLNIAFYEIKNMLLIVSGSVHPNPGPQNKSRLSFGVWNLDSLLAREGCKIDQIEAIQSIHKFDIFGVVESYLNDLTSNEKLKIDGFSPVPFRKDSIGANIHPKGGVCLYFRDDTPIIERNDLATNFDECIVSQIKLKNKKIFIVLIYRSPSQNTPDFDNFLKNINSLLANIDK